MTRMDWEPRIEPWIGYTVAQRLVVNGVGMGYRYARNWLGMHKFFLTLDAAEAYADALNAAATGAK